VESLIEKEKGLSIPIVDVLRATNETIRDYADVLLKVQKARFDLGIDEFKGPLPTMTRAGQMIETRPDGSVVQKKVLEAYSGMQELFKREGIGE
jgi:hypothetical protein